jgi:outer membrane receptor for ferric coprogen and ferric-rhodotorulic acid
MGVRLSLLDGRLTGTVAYYKTAEVNTSVGRDNAFINAINSIWRTLNRVDLFADTASRDSQDTEGEGWEIDITANPTPQWRLAVNFSETEQVTSNIQPRNGAYVEANRALWQQNAALPLQIEGAGVPTTDSTTGQPSTVATAIRLIDGLYAGFKQAEGQSRRQLRQYAGNLFTSYTFKTDRRFLNGLTVGGGANYRGDGVVGYDSSNNNAPIRRGAYVLANVMMARNFKLPGNIRMRLQVNVDNVLDEDELIVSDADQIRDYRYIFQNPRRWSVTGTFSF